MVKYVELFETFTEVPEEISLCINISNCPCHCPGCHSSWLVKDIGIELTKQELSNIILHHDGITCITFMGGDADPNYIKELSDFIHENYNLKTAWYSGKDRELSSINKLSFDFIKVGPYIEERGPLNSPNTNQKMYKKTDEGWLDITKEFQK